MLCYSMLWYGMENMVCYEISMLCYQISMLCSAMVYVVKDKHSATVRFFLRTRLQCSGCVYPMNTKNVLNIAFVIRHKQGPLTLGCTNCTEQNISQLNHVFKIYKYKRGIFSIQLFFFLLMTNVLFLLDCFVFPKFHLYDTKRLKNMNEILVNS